MELQLNALLDFCREPMLTLEGSTVSHMNTAAKALFPTLATGSSAAAVLPDYILFDTAEKSVTAALLGGKDFTVYSAHIYDTRILSFSPERKADRSLVSDGLMSVMNSALFNIGLSAHQFEKSGGFAAPEARRYLTLLQHNYHLLVRHLSNLSLAMHLQEKSVLLRPRRCDLAALCRDLVSSVNSLGEGELAALEFSSALPSLEICIDPELIMQMLLNLLSNSLSHCSSGNTVLLRLEKKGDRAILSVDDDGSGIPDNVLQNVFSRYESLIGSNALSEPLSGGLGLGVSRGIAELHGGALIIESKPNRGTSVRIMLPLEQPGSDILEDAQNAPDYVRLDTLLTGLSDVLRATCYECELDN